MPETLASTAPAPRDRTMKSGRTSSGHYTGGCNLPTRWHALPKCGADKRRRRPLGDRLRVFAIKPPDVLEHDQHFDPENQRQRLRQPARKLRRQLIVQRRDRVLEQVDAMAALELRLLAERAGLAARPLLERQFQRRLEGRLELLDARHPGIDQIGDAARRIRRRGGPGQDRPEPFVDDRADQRCLARKIAIGGGARNAGGLGDLADRRRRAALHQPDRRLEHQPAGAGLGTAFGFVRAGFRLT